MYLSKIDDAFVQNLKYICPKYKKSKLFQNTKYKMSTEQVGDHLSLAQLDNRRGGNNTFVKFGPRLFSL